MPEKLTGSDLEKYNKITSLVEAVFEDRYDNHHQVEIYIYGLEYDRVKGAVRNSIAQFLRQRRLFPRDSHDIVERVTSGILISFSNSSEDSHGYLLVDVDYETGEMSTRQ